MNKIENSQISKGERALYFDPAVEAVSHARKRFVSLKWKAFSLSGFLLFIIMAGSVVGATVYLWSEYKKNQEYHSVMMFSELNVVIRMHAFQLQKASIRMPYFFVEGHITHNGKALDEEGEKELWSLSVDYGVVSIYHLEEGQAKEHSSLISQKLLAEARQYKAPRWEVSCIKVCKITSIMPVSYKNETSFIVMQASIADAFIDFKNLSKSEIMLITLDINRSDSKQIDPWGATVLGMTIEPDSFRFLEKLASKVSVLALSEGYTTNTKSNKVYYLLSRPFSTSNSHAALHLVLMRDVTDAVRQLNSAIFASAMYALAAFIVFQGLILAILWLPMTRLQSITQSLPLLATNHFARLRIELGAVARKAFFIDETDKINSVAIQVSHTLQSLNEQLVQRAHQLDLRDHELEAEKDFVGSLLDSAEIIILTQNSECKIKLVNRHALFLFGKTEKELLQLSFIKLLPQNELLPDLRFQLRELTEGKRNTLQHEGDFVLADGRFLHFAWYHTRLTFRDVKGYDILSIAIDISQRKLAEDHLGWLASHDTMTGLFNRRRFGEELEKVLSSSIRYGSRGALLFFDIDQFKDINDSSGHHVGDDLLKKVARALKKQCRDTDVVARFGGDEFVAILIETDAKKAAEIANRVCRTLEKVEVRGEERIHNATISAGLALFPDHGTTSEELLLNADLAMYQAKENGRNRWVMFDKEGERVNLIQERVFWNEKVKQVLKDDSFEIYFQPIMNLATSVISHYEALLRIFDDDGIILPPQKLILSAEKSGLIKELDFQIIRKALYYKSRLEKVGISISVAINLSGLSFKNDLLVEHIRQLMLKYDIQDTTKVIFEITETAAVSDFQVTIDMMCAIKKLGCKIALDDFGVGFSSLSYLKLFPFDYVKIDGSFIKNVHKDVEDQVLVKAVVAVSKAFGRKTVAEFVENQEIMEILKILEVDYVQGYHLDKPKSFDAIWGNTIKEFENKNS